MYSRTGFVGNQVTRPIVDFPGGRIQTGEGSSESELASMGLMNWATGCSSSKKANGSSTVATREEVLKIPVLGKTV